jgi:hypothetical protein
MAESPPSEEVALWQRRFAAEANNRAWRLSELPSRSSQEDEEMLQAAQAAMYFWKVVGNASNRAHAALLVAHVYALQRLSHQAIHFWAQAEPFFQQTECEPWEWACAMSVKANVAAASGEVETHATSYWEAERQIAALPDPEDRAILNATLRTVRRPSRGVA